VANDALEPLPYKPEHVELLMRALHGVTQEGTSTRVFAGAPYKSGGKTGTAQAVGVRQNEKYDASKLEEHKRDHSLYIAMAPLEAPTVALAVIVENAGFGAAAAAPIARRVFDYLLLGQYPSEEDMAATRKPASRPRPSARRAAPPTCRCRAGRANRDGRRRRPPRCRRPRCGCVSPRGPRPVSAVFERPSPGSA
jgi:penicillin-binding protein 2